VARAVAELEIRVRDDAGEVPWTELVAIVRRQMASIVGPGPDLEDLAQTALERVLRGLGRFESRAELSTYAYKVCVRVALNHWRWWRRWLRRFEPVTEKTPEPPDTRCAAGDALVERERAIRLYALLEGLSPMHRAVVTLADLEELPTRRIAEILECPEPTVRSRLRLARSALAERMARDPHITDSIERRDRTR
jgi:RNA polymerase sigma-70 factor (ECF subfamily)